MAKTSKEKNAGPGGGQPKKRSYILSEKQRYQKMHHQRWKRLKAKIQRQFLSLDPPIHIAAICVVGGRNPGVDVVGSSLIIQTLFKDKALNSLRHQLFEELPHRLRPKKRTCTPCSFTTDWKTETMKTTDMRTFAGEAVAKYVQRKFKKRRGYWGNEEMKPSWWPEGVPFMHPSVSGVTKDGLQKICQAIAEHENRPSKKKKKKKKDKKSD